ncbi:3-hydroxydecanoyl-ACP dehydratase [Alteromonas sp. H39]|uniref:ApeP family dehydratase n=1 Tax=Alteromonas sp. H39 TaxID=3389876 RepID=UPI0039DF940B
MTMQRYDARIFDLIPHRPPMLLINKIESVTQSASSALVYIDSDAPFYEPGLGVPAWIGLEYMGQTAALIAGYQLQQGLVSPHLGFLLGTRAFKAHCAYFTAGVLKVSCQQQALVGEGLATFKCIIENYAGEAEGGSCLAEANLSVFRREIT